MKIKFVLPFLMLALGINITNAQVTFPAGTNLCESTPWKLVWYDEFNGSAINTDKWYTFLDNNSWNNGQVVVPPVSQESRTLNRGANFMDANVTVSGGTCKLTAKYEPNTWVNSYKQYTAGLIKAKNSGDNTPMFFNRGKFEMRARITKAEKTWAAYWLWLAGGHAGGDSEIDIFEYMPTNDANENTYSLHGWNRPGTSSETTVTGTFSYNNIDAWHIYVCEWDNNFVRIYMDNQLKFQGSRYTLAGASGTSSGCQPLAGTAYVEDINKAFPFADESMSLICHMDYRDNVEAGRADGVFEIDYIRVYQRTPQHNLRDLCSYVSGPTTICLNVPTTYYATIGEGTFTGWTVSPNMQILASGINNGQPYITVKGITSALSMITANVSNAPYSCPASYLQVSVGSPSAMANVITTGPTSGHYNNQLSILNPVQGATYEWYIKTTTPNAWVSKFGPNVSVVSNYKPLCFWVSATNTCGSDYQEYGGCLLKPGMPEEETLQTGALAELKDKEQDDLEQSGISLYPNPASGYITIKLNEESLGGSMVTGVRVADMSGRMLKAEGKIPVGAKEYRLDLSDIPSGMYWINIRNEKVNVYKKFVKQ